MELELSIGSTKVVSIEAECERLLLAFRDVPSTYAALRELVAFLTDLRDRSGTEGWRLSVEALRQHELGRLLRNDPMVRRCQWRAADAEPYDIVEAFVREWDDAAESLLEAEEVGQSLNTVTIAGPIGTAMRERRDGVRPFLLNAVRRGFKPDILGLGAGRASEADIFAAGDHHGINSWTVVDEDRGEDASLRRRGMDFPHRRNASPQDYLGHAPADARFDLIYATHALDTLGDDAALDFLNSAVARLKPNGCLLVSSFAPSLREAVYMNAVLDWHPTVRDERMMTRLLGSVPLPPHATSTVWKGASEGVIFGLIERKAWAD